MKEAVITVSTNNLKDAISLEDLYDLVTEALELGLPPKKTHVIVNGNHVYGQVQVVFMTTDIEPILCGNHMSGEDKFDVLVGTHNDLSTDNE